MEQLETCVQDVSSMMFSHKFQIFQLFKNFSTSIWGLLHLKIWRNLLVSQETLPTAMWPGTFGVSRHNHHHPNWRTHHIFQRGRLKPRSSFYIVFILGAIIVNWESSSVWNIFSKSKAINQKIKLAFGNGLYIAFMLFVFQRMVYCGVYHMSPETCRFSVKPRY